MSQAGEFSDRAADEALYDQTLPEYVHVNSLFDNMATRHAALISR